jgi:Cu(I)/Ag(I) efflux system membrane fusion protein
LTFYSPITGFVTDRKAFPQTSVTPETELYTVSDLSTVWADVDVFEYEVPYVHLGQHVSLSMSYYPGKTYTGPITYIYPTVDPQTRTVKVRIQIANQDFALKPQMFADAQILVNYGTKVVVPQERNRSLSCILVEYSSPEKLRLGLPLTVVSQSCRDSKPARPS